MTHTVTNIVNDLGNVTFGRLESDAFNGRTYYHVTIIASDMPIQRTELFEYFHWVTSVNYKISGHTQESNCVSVSLDTRFFTLEECLAELDGVLKAFVPNKEIDE